MPNALPEKSSSTLSQLIYGVFAGIRMLAEDLFLKEVEVTVSDQNKTEK